MQSKCRVKLLFGERYNFYWSNGWIFNQLPKWTIIFWCRHVNVSGEIWQKETELVLDLSTAKLVEGVLQIVVLDEVRGTSQLAGRCRTNVLMNFSTLFKTFPLAGTYQVTLSSGRRVHCGRWRAFCRVRSSSSVCPLSPVWAPPESDYPAD